MKKTILTALLIMCLGSFAYSAMLMTPYLQAVKKDSIYVLVEADTRDPVTVEYGVDGKFGKSLTAESVSSTLLEKPTYIHKIKLTGLKAGTLYHYRALQSGAASPDFTFNTAVEEGTNFRFAWMADCRTGTDIHEAIAANIKKAKPLFSLYGGDLCEDSTYLSFKSEFFLKNELALIAEVPFFNTVGNHETAGKNTEAFTQSPDSASGEQKYYSLDYGDMHVLVMNTEIAYTPESAQYRFVKSDLEKSKKVWKLVITHIPPYVDGTRKENLKLISISRQLFEPNKVDMTISGHDHFYQHNIVKGIHHMVIGSAGAPLYTPKNDKPFVKKSAEEHNYAIMDVTPKSFHMIVYNEKDEVLDTIDLVKPKTIK